MHNEITMAGQKPVDQSQELSVQADGVIEVLGVNAKGGESKLAFTVKKLLRTDQNPAVDILPAGTVVTAEPGNQPGGQKTNFTVEGKEVTPEQGMALQIVLGADSPNKPTDDETFGTATPQKIGAVWPIDKNNVADGAKESGVDVKPENVTGQGTLVAITPIDGKQFANVKAEFTAKDIEGALPGGMKIEACKIDAKFSGLFPVESTVVGRSETMEMTMDMRAKGAAPDGGIVSVHVIVQMHAEHKRSAVAP